MFNVCVASPKLHRRFEASFHLTSFVSQLVVLEHNAAELALVPTSTLSKVAC